MPAAEAHPAAATGQLSQPSHASSRGARSGRPGAAGRGRPSTALSATPGAAAQRRRRSVAAAADVRRPPAAGDRRGAPAAAPPAGRDRRSAAGQPAGGRHAATCRRPRSRRHRRTFTNGSAALPAPAAETLRQLAARSGDGRVVVTGYGRRHRQSTRMLDPRRSTLGLSRAQAMAEVLVSGQRTAFGCAGRCRSERSRRHRTSGTISAGIRETPYDRSDQSE